MTGRDDVAHNRMAYDALGGAYDARHPEIFNEVEQARLRGVVTRAVGAAATGRPVRALDVGAGTGNVTAHLIAVGACVTAADLSTELLAEVQRRFGSHGIEGVVALDGETLAPIPDGSFDVVMAYSVLHHVPDYLRLVGEMARVTAPGGVVVIDHERTDESWTSREYTEFLSSASVWPRRRWWYWLQPSRYWKRLKPLLEWRRWGNPRWMPEGDLHIWPDDHIEWAKVEDRLARAGCETVARDDYLLYEPRFVRAVWEEWRTRTADMRTLVARKVR